MYFFILPLLQIVAADIADYTTVPKGTNPTLYSPDDHVIQLDESTFNDTVYCSGPDCSAFLVEFYSDWCGHCRAFAPLYKKLAQDVKGWESVVKIAAMNCADQVNEVTCRANGVEYFPFIKYFPRNSSAAFSGNKLRAFHTLAEMRDQLTKVVMDDYAVNRFPDWPDFDLLHNAKIWEGAGNAQYVAVVFESHQASLTGAQLLLDLSRYSDKLTVRRALRSNPLADVLHITDFPSLAIFKRRETLPVLVAELRRLLLNEVETFITGGAKHELIGNGIQMHSRKINRTAYCEEHPEECRPQYYVSEVDMLKAMRYALYRETARTGENLEGQNLTALYHFLNTLADHFPTTTLVDPATMNETDTVKDDVPTGNNTMFSGIYSFIYNLFGLGSKIEQRKETVLDRSTRAVRVFMRLREFIEQRGVGNVISIEDWRKEFQNAELEAGNPFPTSAEWDHCKGSTTQYRGYTCGLWTAFHTLTVTAYRQTANSADFHPLPVLQSIRDWVGNFFGCIHCREHFLRMTTRSFKMEDKVRKNEDIFMYLWRAHNIVNARLKGRDTEDPMFPKFQFPAPFLCSNCTVNGEPDEDVVHDYLINYYSQIKPYKASLTEALRL